MTRLTKNSHQHFSQETINALVELSNTLRRIHRRLIREGRVVTRGGKVIFLEQDKQRVKRRI